MDKCFRLFIIIYKKALDVLFPTECVICNTQGSDICLSCLDSLRHAKPTAHDWVASFWDYHDPNVEIMMRYLKTYPNIRLIRRIVAFIKKNYIGNLNSLINFDIQDNLVIIPVPIHKTRFRERGFNQSELLARAFSAKTPAPVFTTILFKKNYTRKQGTLLSRQERMNNLTGSFEVKNKKSLFGKKIIIIDDIVTTGSTLQEIRKTLIASGATSVSAITIAN